MGLFGFIPEPLRAGFGHFLEMAKPDRAAAVADLAIELASRRGVDRSRAEPAIREAVRVGEAALLDTPEGRAVILLDAAESVADSAT